MILSEKLKAVWHGADYNPDQWLDYPEVLEKDIELMKKSGCNVMSIGIFAWATLEPEENKFNFEWLDGVINNLYKNGIYTVLATPSGAMPAWMAIKYPEVKRVSEDGIRARFGVRHNNCYSSPIYREKVKIINSKLAERYANHPAVVMWHISNEYNVLDCHCPLCRENFRNWLKEKYKTIENLNQKWWNKFWSHSYQDFSQIDPPGEHGEFSSNPLSLDWMRFKSYMLRSFLKHEVDTVKKYNPDLPVTANFMRYWDADYIEASKYVDFISWDNYPLWHSESDDFLPATETALFHSYFNSLKKDRPFMMMESSPSATNWQSVSKLRRPGVHLLASMQAVAHGSDTVQYFQWRKSRGQSEQFHGAVVSHDNSDDTRIFREVSSVGKRLSEIPEIIGSKTQNEAAILFDHENIWALSIAQAYRNCDSDKGYMRNLTKTFGALWNLNIGTDFVFAHEDFSKYKVIIAPMLFMLKSGVKEKLEKFVENGGVFITTFASGVIDEFGLSFFDKECYPLRKLLGVKCEETDSLYDGQFNLIDYLDTEYKCENYCELAYCEGAEIQGVYKTDFYKNMPAVTLNSYGKGKAYYIAAELDCKGLTALFEEWLTPIISNEKLIKTPENVSVTLRYSENNTYMFIMNFNSDAKEISIPEGFEIISGKIRDNLIEPYAVIILKK